MVPQIFPGYKDGFTAFTGVFRHDVDLPWLNSVDITSTDYEVRNDFSQYLNQYHTAHMPVYNEESETMHTIFFGGIGRYTLDPQSGDMIDDQLVPFVKTISRMTRYANDSVVEYQLPTSMPGYLGTSAEFIPGKPEYFVRNEILELDKLPLGKSFVGYIFGGIESTRPNTFFSNEPNLTKASNRIFKVYIDKSQPSDADYRAITQSDLLNFDLYPNPTNNSVRIEFFVAEAMSPILILYEPSGKLLRAFNFGRLEIGSYHHTFSVLGYDPGIYLVKFRHENIEKARKLVVK